MKTDPELKQLLARMLPEKVCGVYSFQHIPTGKYYVGSSINIYRRAMIHLRKAEAGSKNYFRKSLRELGFDSFRFAILEICEPSQRLKSESVWIRALNATFPDGFNLYAEPTIGFDYHFSDAMRKKIGAAQAGRRHSEESKKLISIANKGKRLSLEHRRKISIAMTGNPKLVGRKMIFSKSHKEKLSKAATGRKLSEETKQKISKIKKEFYANRQRNA